MGIFQWGREDTFWSVNFCLLQFRIQTRSFTFSEGGTKVREKKTSHGSQVDERFRDCRFLLFSVQKNHHWGICVGLLLSIREGCAALILTRCRSLRKSDQIILRTYSYLSTRTRQSGTTYLFRNVLSSTARFSPTNRKEKSFTDILRSTATIKLRECENKKSYLSPLLGRPKI